MEKSNCCQEPVRVHSGVEGTNYYICTGCEEPCDLENEEV